MPNLKKSEQIEWMKSKEKPTDVKYWKTLYAEQEKDVKEYRKRNEQMKEELEEMETELELIDAEIEHWNQICEEGFELAAELDELVNSETLVTKETK